MEDKTKDVVNEPLVPYGSTPVYTVPNKNGLFTMLSSVSLDDIPVAIKYLVDKLASFHVSSESTPAVHSWDNYELSDEVKAMAPPVRKKVYGNYDDVLQEILEEKYR